LRLFWLLQGIEATARIEQIQHHKATFFILQKQVEKVGATLAVAQ
jgi:hypothetical protein